MLYLYRVVTFLMLISSLYSVVIEGIDADAEAHQLIIENNLRLEKYFLEKAKKVAGDDYEDVPFEQRIAMMKAVGKGYILTEKIVVPVVKQIFNAYVSLRFFALSPMTMESIFVGAKKKLLIILLKLALFFVGVFYGRRA